MRQYLVSLQDTITASNSALRLASLMLCSFGSALGVFECMLLDVSITQFLKFSGATVPGLLTGCISPAWLRSSPIAAALLRMRLGYAVLQSMDPLSPKIGKSLQSSVQFPVCLQDALHQHGFKLSPQAGSFGAVLSVVRVATSVWKFGYSPASCMWRVPPDVECNHGSLSSSAANKLDEAFRSCGLAHSTFEVRAPAVHSGADRCSSP
jgi:hypothetical protein